ncbi:YczE/YyaS/YitT family protein [Bacillus seohaeanensis]|jgi:uncharacterized protein|uniref:YitT family protein n=1 Tax=Bacillus seohaeanensis TaxID=284580 RepID=A0ABW5RXY7_9BACI
MRIFLRFLFFVIGILVFSYGISMAIKVQYLGIHPWDVLNIALFDKWGLTIGTWNLIVGGVLISGTLFLNRKYVRIGTILNGLMVGPLVDLYLFWDILPQRSSLYLDAIILILAIIIMGIGGGLYSASGLGTGPRDGFMLSLSELTGQSISKVRIAFESSILIIGWLLGGPIFIFTFIYTFIQSPIFQFSFLHFTKLLDSYSASRSNNFNL